MSKKQFVIEMLEKLMPNRALAQDLKKFILLDILNNDSVNAIAQLIRDMANYIKDKRLKQNMIAIASAMDHMKDIELQEKLTDQENAEQLLLNLQ